MNRRAVCWWVLLLVFRTVINARPQDPLVFEDAVRSSDRIVIATVLGTSGGSAHIPGAGDVALGIKDPITGLVFTPYRVRIVTCLFDTTDSCRPGDGEVLVPGGTVYETVDGQQRLRTWEVAGAAGVPLPTGGDDLLLFMTERNGRYQPLNDRGARVPVERGLSGASVELRFKSPVFLSEDRRDSVRADSAKANPASTRPEFTESVDVDRLKSLIALARQVPKPTSGIGHAIPDRADVLGARIVGKRRVGVHPS